MIYLLQWLKMLDCSLWNLSILFSPVLAGKCPKVCAPPNHCHPLFFTWWHPPHRSLFHFGGFGCKISEFLCWIVYPQLVQFPSNLHKIDLTEPTILKTSHSAIAQPCAKSLPDYKSRTSKENQTWPRKLLTIVWSAYKWLQMAPCILLSKQCFISCELPSESLLQEKLRVFWLSILSKNVVFTMVYWWIMTTFL